MTLWRNKFPSFLFVFGKGESKSLKSRRMGEFPKFSFQENHFIDYIKAFDWVHYNKMWKILKEMGTPDYITCLLRKPYASQEATVRTEHGITNWFKIGKGEVKAVYYNSAYLTYMQSTSCDMLAWMSYKLESRMLGEISTASNMQMIPLEWHKVKRN